MPKLIVSGFEPWARNPDGGLHLNSAELAVGAVKVAANVIIHALGGFEGGRIQEIETCILPAAPQEGKFDTLKDFEKIRAALHDKVLSNLDEGDLFIGFGQGGYCVPSFSVESHFFNRYAAPGTDQQEIVFESENYPNPCIGFGHELTNKRVDEIVQLVPSLVGQVVAANNPGVFNCNYVGRRMFERLGKDSMFVHVPFCVSSLQAEGLFRRNPEKLFGLGIKKPAEISIFSPDLVIDFVIAAVKVMLATSGED